MSITPSHIPVPTSRVCPCAVAIAAPLIQQALEECPSRTGARHSCAAPRANPFHTCREPTASLSSGICQHQLGTCQISHVWSVSPKPALSPRVGDDRMLPRCHPAVLSHLGLWQGTVPGMWRGQGQGHLTPDPMWEGGGEGEGGREVKSAGNGGTPLKINPGCRGARAVVLEAHQTDNLGGKHCNSQAESPSPVPTPWGTKEGTYKEEGEEGGRRPRTSPSSPQQHPPPAVLTPPPTCRAALAVVRLVL